MNKLIRRAIQQLYLELTAIYEEMEDADEETTEHLMELATAIEYRIVDLKDVMSCDDLDGSEDNWVDRFMSDYHGSPYALIDDIAREAASRFVKQTLDYWADDINGVVQPKDKL